ncbi:MAG: ABC transporter ATP-binding protein [Bacteroidales bacterium]|jgi:iron complex transport system ATP-binding protein|nr:ABC transporter ATP-binding protein [Bacteroidales bacterium]
MQNLDKILKIKNLEIGYPSKKDASNILFRDINLTGNSGELIALVGKNGIGKSTLLRNITGLQQAINGNILFFDKHKETYSRTEFARMVSFVSTEIVNINNLSVFDLVSLGRFPHTNWFGKLKSDDIIKSRLALEMVGMDSFARKNVNEISDGERQRVMVARTLAQDTKIIVLDEPTAFLDLPNKYEIVHLLNNLSKQENKTILFSTHDLNIAIQEADKIWLMLEDEIIEGAPEDLILNETFNKIFEKSSLSFDKVKGDFRMKRKHSEKIGLFGDGVHYTWTKKALERLNYSVEKENELIQHIKVEIKDNLHVWKLIEDGNIHEFYSIYDLSLYLKKYTK